MMTDPQQLILRAFRACYGPYPGLGRGIAVSGLCGCRRA